MRDISVFNQIRDYLPIFNGVLIADIIIMVLLFYTNFLNSEPLSLWYEKFRLSAVIADVFIIVIGFIIARYFYPKIFKEFSIWKFIGLLLVIQIIHDVLFYIVAIQGTPKGMNKMMDLFKVYAKKSGSGAIIGDSSMMIISGLMAYWLSGLSDNANIILMIVLVYMIPYILYAR